MRENAVPKNAVQARNVNDSNWEDVNASQALCCLCVPGISYWTESQLDCLWSSFKSRQDTKLSSESLRVSYQFHSLPDAPFGSPQNQFFPTECDTDWKWFQENSNVLVEYIKFKKLFFSGSQLWTRPHWSVHWLTGCPHSLHPLSPCCLTTVFNQITHTKAQVSHNIKKNKIKPVYPICSMHRKPVAQPQDSAVECRGKQPTSFLLCSPSAILPSLQMDVNSLLLLFSHLSYVLVSRKISPQQSFLHTKVHFSSHS